MAKKMTSAPMTRLSAGVYRDASGKTVRSTTGKVTKPKDNKGKGKGMTTKPVKSAPLADPNLNVNQQQIQSNLEQGDIGLSSARNTWADKVGQMGDFAYTGPAAPQYNPEERKRIEDELIARFDRYDAPQRQIENEDLARWGQATGNSVDSPAYAARAKQLADSQNARALDARSQAVSQGLSESQGQFEMGQNAHQTAYGEQLDAYGRPLQIAGQVQGLISPMTANAQNQGYQMAQIGETGKQQRQTQKAAFKLTHSGGGGSRAGGGRGRGGMTAAPQGYTPQYMGGQPGAVGGQPSQPSYLSQLGNSLIGPLAKAGGEKLGNYIFSSLLE